MELYIAIYCLLCYLSLGRWMAELGHDSVAFGEGCNYTAETPANIMGLFFFVITPAVPIAVLASVVVFVTLWGLFVLLGAMGKMVVGRGD